MKKAKLTATPEEHLAKVRAIIEALPIPIQSIVLESATVLRELIAQADAVHPNTGQLALTLVMNEILAGVIPEPIGSNAPRIITIN